MKRMVDKLMVRGIVFHKHNFELLILSKLHWCFGHGLKICIWFGYNPSPQIIFC